MSTRCSVRWGDDFHLYTDAFDTFVEPDSDPPLYLALAEVEFDAHRRSDGFELTVRIPLDVWRALGPADPSLMLDEDNVVLRHEVAAVVLTLRSGGFEASYADITSYHLSGNRLTLLLPHAVAARLGLPFEREDPRPFLFRVTEDGTRERLDRDESGLPP